MKITDFPYFVSKLPEIRDTAAKYDRGHLLLVAGSYGMAGACILAAKAAYFSGVGYLTIAMPKSIYPIITAAVPEAVCLPYDETDPVETRRLLKQAVKRADAVCMGPGLGELRDIICPMILECDIPKLLLDADALNHLSEHPENLPARPFVMTPHSGEAARLLKNSRKNVEENRELSARLLAERYHAAALLKGKDTLIHDGRECFMNRTGNAGMAKAGSGDVLSGIIGSFLAQGMDLMPAAVCGAFLHGLAGDLAKESYGIRSMGPQQLIEKIPEVLKSVEE